MSLRMYFKCTSDSLRTHIESTTTLSPFMFKLHLYTLPITLRCHCDPAADFGLTPISLRSQKGMRAQHVARIHPHTPFHLPPNRLGAALGMWLERLRARERAQESKNMHLYMCMCRNQGEAARLPSIPGTPSMTRVNPFSNVLATPRQGRRSAISPSRQL